MVLSMRAFLILLVALLIGNANAASSSDHEAIAQKDQKAEQNKATTNAVPVEKFKPSPVKDAGNKPNTHADEKLNVDRQIAEYTGQLAIYTERLSTFTLWLVGATVILGFIGGFQGWLLKRTVDLTRDEFYASHRPKLIVRRIAPIEYEDKEIPVGVRYAVHNVGDSSATIIAISEKIWLPEDSVNLPAIPPYNATIEQNITLESGDWREFRCIAPVDDQEELEFRFGFGKAKSPINPATDGDILFLGYIDYIDRMGRKRQTAFLRSFDCKVKRFSPINHIEYEYQD